MCEPLIQRGIIYHSRDVEVVFVYSLWCFSLAGILTRIAERCRLAGICISEKHHAAHALRFVSHFFGAQALVAERRWGLLVILDSQDQFAIGRRPHAPCRNFVDSHLFKGRTIKAFDGRRQERPHAVDGFDVELSWKEQARVQGIHRLELALRELLWLLRQCAQLIVASVEVVS